MTNKDLKRLRDLADAATPGPWRTIETDDYPGKCWGVVGPRRVHAADAAFIAASRMAIPELLAMLENAKAAHSTVVEAYEARIAELEWAAVHHRWACVQLADLRAQLENDE